jgi:hypothetical protein
MPGLFVQDRATYTIPRFAPCPAHKKDGGNFPSASFASRASEEIRREADPTGAWNSVAILSGLRREIKEGMEMPVECAILRIWKWCMALSGRI